MSTSLNIRGPDFVIIGAMKSGTTSLFRWLNSHSECDLCQIKETHFFSRNWHRGLPWYLDLFRQVEATRMTGEASPSYTHPDNCEAVADRLYNTFPNAKIIYLVRDPIGRMRSEFRHEVQRDRESREFDVALESEDRPYWRRSMYWSCLQPFTSRFDRERVKVIRFEDLVSEENDTWFDVLDYLGLAREERQEIKINKTSGKAGFRGLTRVMYSSGFGRIGGKMPASIRKTLRPLFFTESDDYFKLVNTCRRSVPAGVEAQVWEDIEKLEQWSGGGQLWER